MLSLYSFFNCFKGLAEKKKIFIKSLGLDISEHNRKKLIINGFIDKLTTLYTGLVEVEEAGDYSGLLHQGRGQLHRGLRARQHDALIQGRID